MGQVAVKSCYTKGDAWVKELVEYIAGNIAWAREFVKANFPKATFVEPEGTYLVWIDFSGYGLSDDELEHLMVDEPNCGWIPGRSSDRPPPSSNGSTWPAPGPLWKRPSGS